MRRKITFECDPTELFDTLTKVGDGGQSLGIRMVGALLADAPLSDEIGMAFYGVTLTQEPPNPPSKEQNNVS